MSAIDPQAYNEKIHSLKDEMEHFNFYEMNDELRKEFLFAAAGKNIFLGKGVLSDAETFFRECMFYKNLTLLDIQTDIRLLYEMVKLKGNLKFIEEIKKKPAIFCTFHYGAYQLILPYLSILGIDFYVVTKQEYNINEIMAYDHKSAGVFERKADTIRPDEWSILLDLSNKIREGKSIIVFLDRTEGVTEQEQNRKKMASVNFMGQQLYARKGIPEISYIRNIPIIPVISHRNSHTDIALHFGEPMVADKSENRNTYSQRALQTSFTMLEEFTRTSPTQWEYWPEVYSRLDLEKFNPYNNKVGFSWKKLFGLEKEESKNEFIIAPINIPIEEEQFCMFNAERYGMYLENENYYLFDTYTYNCFKITSNLFKVLDTLNHSTRKKAVLRKLINPSLFEELLLKGVLIGDANNVKVEKIEATEVNTSI